MFYNASLTVFISTFDIILSFRGQRFDFIKLRRDRSVPEQNKSAELKKNGFSVKHFIFISTCKIQRERTWCSTTSYRTNRVTRADVVREIVI